MVDDQKSVDIHREISYLLQNALSVYEVDAEMLTDLNPDIILTQDHCEVCAVSMADLTHSVKQTLGVETKILSVSPSDLDSVFESFKYIAAELGVPEKGTGLVENIRSRFDDIGNVVKELPKPTVVAIEWIDPLMTGGNWMPEMIEIAGGICRLAAASEHSSWMDWDEIKQVDPEILLILPCGYSIEQTMAEMATLESQPGWNEMRSVCQKNVYILDGNHYFNRPGPRIRESVEILARIFHPDYFEKKIDQFGWIRYKPQ